MNVPADLAKFIGRWKGSNRLYLGSKPEEIFDSQTNAAIDFTAKGRFLKIEYDWSYEEKPHEGLILLGRNKDSEKIIAFWIDSFHLSDKYMVSEGETDADGSISLKGFYTVPGYPEWGWRTVFDFQSDDSFKIIMYNVSPEGTEEIAVEAVYARRDS